MDDKYMTEIVYIGVALYVGWLIYQFPLFELHREAHRRNVEVSPSICSLGSVRLFCRWVFVGVLYFSSAILWMMIAFGTPYYLRELDILPAPDGWWILLFGIVFLGWMIITGSVFSVVLELLTAKLKDFKQPLDSIKQQVEELKSQSVPLLKSKPETPSIVRHMQRFSGLKRYKTFEERFPDGVIQPRKPSPLRYILYALLLVFLGLPIVLSIVNGDWSKLHLYWVIPVSLIGLILFLYLGGFLFSVIGTIILKPLNIYFEHSSKSEPYLLMVCNNLLSIDINEDKQPILGILFWGLVAIWHWTDFFKIFTWLFGG